MSRFFSPEFFEELAQRLSGDQEWRRKSGELETKIMATCTDRNLSALLTIRGGEVAVSMVAAEEPADFKFEGTYDAWVATAQGEKDLQTLVMTGKMRFKGSMSRIMAMMGPLTRLTAVLREMPKEF